MSYSLRLRTAALAVTVLLLGLATPPRADDKKEAGGQMPMVKPGKEHELLKQLEGTWDATVKVTMSPDQPPSVSRGTETNKLTCGGLWLVSSFKSEMFGQPFEGHGVYGYDPEKKKYTSVWVDSMETKLSLSEGSFSEDGKVFTMVMDGRDMSGKPTKYKMVTRFKDKDQHVFTMSMPGPDGKDVVVLTIEYKRKK